MCSRPQLMGELPTLPSTHARWPFLGQRAAVGSQPFYSRPSFEAPTFAHTSPLLMTSWFFPTG